MIRAIRAEELEQAFKIRLQTNYVFSKSSVQSAWTTDPENFLVAVNDNGEKAKNEQGFIYLDVFESRDESIAYTLATVEEGDKFAGLEQEQMTSAPLEPTRGLCKDVRANKFCHVRQNFSTRAILEKPPDTDSNLFKIQISRNSAPRLL